MKLSFQLAGLCGSAAFIVTALPGFFQQVKPTSMESMANDAIPGMTILEILGIALAWAISASVIGWIMGDILSNPQGQSKKQKKAQKAAARQLAVEPVVANEAPAVEPIPYTETPQPVAEMAPPSEVPAEAPPEA